MALGQATIEYFVEDENGVPILQEDGLEFIIEEVPSRLVFGALPVITFRMGQPLLENPQAWVVPQYQHFPYWVTSAPARPVIFYRMGQWISQDVLPLVGIHGYQAFPYFNANAAPVADQNTYIPTFRPRRGR
jgi:hypothetical protein